MNIEIICVGNELLAGITHNTNAQWLCKKITGMGATVNRVTVVADRLQEISLIVREALQRKPAMIIVTGGLGATYDDLTLQGVALSLHRKLVLDPTAVEMLKKSYSRRLLQYRLDKTRLKMARIPDGSTPIQNPVGSAPAVSIEVKVEVAAKSKLGKKTAPAPSTTIFCLPGVPSEMQAIFQENIAPRIRKKVGSFFFNEVIYEVAGITESMIAPALLDTVRSNSKKAIYIKTHPAGFRGPTPRIRVQIVSKGKYKEKVRRRLDLVSKNILNEIKSLGGKIMVAGQTEWD
jgi:nicotinamide-nucleotide amidase